MLQLYTISNWRWEGIHVYVVELGTEIQIKRINRRSLLGGFHSVSGQKVAFL